MQFQADISNLEVICPDSPEATALGAAFLAGLISGFWKNRQEIKNLSESENRFSSNMKSENREVLLEGWQRAVMAAQTFNNRSK